MTLICFYSRSGEGSGIQSSAVLLGIVEETEGGEGGLLEQESCGR